MVLLDDMHAADIASLEAMRHLVQAAIPGVATIGAMRSGVSMFADEAARALGREGSAHVVEVEPLSASGVADLIAALLDAHPPDDLVSDIVGRTDGVPLLVEEVVLAHLRAGTVEVHEGATTWREGNATVPKTIRELIDARLAGLDAKHRRVIVAGAVVGDFEPALMVEVAGADDGVVSDALSAAVRAGLLETSGGAIAFRHAIIREAVLDATVPHVVDTMHRRAAAALDQPSSGAGLDFIRLERRAGHLRAVAANDEAAEALTAAACQVGLLALLGAEHAARGDVDRTIAGDAGGSSGRARAITRDAGPLA